MGIYNGPEGDDPYPSSWYVAREQEAEEAKKKAKFLKNNPNWKAAWEPNKARYDILKLKANALAQENQTVPDWMTEEMLRIEEHYPERVVVYPGIADSWQTYVPTRERQIQVNGARYPLISMDRMEVGPTPEEVDQIAESIKGYLESVDITGEFENLGDEPWNT